MIPTESLSQERCSLSGKFEWCGHAL